MEKSSSSSRLLAIFLVLLGGASYGLLSPLVKSAYHAGFSAEDVTSSQFTAAMLVIWIGAFFRIKQFRLLTRRDLGILAIIGVLSTGTTLFYYTSLVWLPASLAIVLLFQFTWVTMLIDFLVTRKKPTIHRWIALALILAGTVMAVNLWHEEWGNVSLLGLILGILSAVSYSLFLYVNGRIRSKAPAIVNSAVLVTTSAVTIYFVFPPAFLWNGTLPQGLWVWAFLIGCLGQVIPPVLFTIGIPKIGGSLAAVLGAIELPVGVVASFLILREPILLIQWMGVLLILGGMIVAQWQPGKRKLSAAKP
ncbi:multidrug transporter [Collibacillus ludicampi]|uniref:Multidrug transporter n=1 Tax=Collibacillus ludicampi TaxID=2771369 RepID=A0AAV4LCN4_9BACL|nr:DMT family transporter [Collibacillus ludicampi]GIM45459.1 multidrug transporter [Collibacillus ludicampi]